jgi:hypothetical protein
MKREMRTEINKVADLIRFMNVEARKYGRIVGKTDGKSDMVNGAGMLKQWLNLNKFPSKIFALIGEGSGENLDFQMTAFTFDEDGNITND